MKQLFLICAAMMAAVAAQASPKTPDLIAGIHFAGAKRISADTNALAFTNLWCAPDAQELREQTLNKLSHFPHTWFKERIIAGTNDGAAEIRPLLDDLLNAEWSFGVWDTTNALPDCALVIRLGDDRAALWQTNLASVLQLWTKGTVQKKQGGWEFKKSQPPDLIRFVRSGGWTVIACGQNELPSGDEIVRRVLAGNEKNQWLSLTADWPRLAQRYHSLEKVGLPKMNMQVAGRENNLQLRGKFTLAQPLAPLPKWRVPTNTIYQPFVTFTAARGFGRWLERQNWAQPFKLQPPLDQFFVWAPPQVPAQTYAAVPVDNATNAIRELGEKLAAAFNSSLRKQVLGAIQPVTNEARIEWRDLPPFVAPFAQAIQEPAGSFLLAGLFPYWPDTNPPPADILRQFSRTNLLYYHWEITAERLPEVLFLSQLTLMLKQCRQLDVLQSPAGKWLKRVGSTLGSNITEITQTAPNELTFTRQAPGGFTAIELVALANWLEATNFPGCDLRLPPDLEPPDDSPAASAPAASAPAH